jgi:murein L,D-transpeptidase YcbB/YkuD
MRVIVGKPASATPALRSTLHFATVNPYWYVPTDLARTIIAPRVLKEGTRYLRERGYQVISGFTSNAHVLRSESIDWKSVADDRAKAYVRQLPGPANSMGHIKFGFASSDGIFLHDTPTKRSFAKADRNISNGCVRLEDAPRLARWLLGHDPVVSSAAPEQHLRLPRPVPLVIAHLDRQAQLELAQLR